MLPAFHSDNSSGIQDVKQKIRAASKIFERGANFTQTAREPYRPPSGENQLREGEGGDPVGVGALHIWHTYITNSGGNYSINPKLNAVILWDCD